MIIYNSNNAIETEELLKRTILQKLDHLYLGKNKAFQNNILVIGINDTNTYNSLNNTTFIDDTRGFLANEGYSFAKISIKNHFEEEWTLVDDNIRFLITNSSTTKTDEHKLQISIFNGKGSLAQETYFLEPIDESIYYIGRGLDKRENDIIIENTQSAEAWEYNRYVRSAHAHITYQTKNDFLLWPDKDGTPAFHSRTRIIRKGYENPIDLTEVHAPQRLLDGDIIELGKHVQLKIKLVSNPN